MFRGGFAKLMYIEWKLKDTYKLICFHNTAAWERKKQKWIIKTSVS